MTRTLLTACAFLIAASASAQANQTVAPRTDADLRASYAPVVERAAPAVVNVYTKRAVRTRGRTTGDPFFDRFFGFDRGMRERVQSSLGSGVIVDPSGVIVTNNHVVDGADEILVVLNDRREFAAEVVLTDPQTDLAILTVEAEGLPSLEFADSDGAQVGDVVLAIGNPFGVGQTVTSGIVSATARPASSVSDYQFFLQTDAAINPGNSGGALVDASGDLLGVNTAIYSRSGGSNGIGFAIPGNLVERVVAQATRGETTVRRPWLGVEGRSVDRRIAEAVGLDRPGGALVARVFPGGPGEKAGLREGDVVVRIAGQDVFAPEALRFRPATREAGERIDLVVVRGGEERTLRARLDYPPEEPARDERTLAGRSVLAGATVANLSPALAEGLGRDPFDAAGVVILRVEPRSPAARYGLRANLVIEGVNGQRVPDTATLDRLNATLGGRTVLTLRRLDGRRSTLRVGR